MNAKQIADRIVNKSGSYQEVMNYAEGMISPLIERAEAAEARAAQLETDNDEMQAYINEIRVALHTEKDELTIDAVRRVISERDEARRQLSEAQRAIDVLSKTVVAQDAEIKRLRQQREDVEQYRAEIDRLNQAATA